MKSQLHCLTALGLAVSASAAQVRPVALEPVHWAAEANVSSTMHAGSRFAVLLHASIDDGWRLYALQDRESFPLATEIALAKNSSVDLLRVDEEKPHHSIDPESHVVTGWFARSTTFTLHLATVAGTLRDLQVLVRYQACNERMCLPAKQVTVPVQLSGGR